MSYEDYKEDFFTVDVCEKKGRKPEVLKQRYLPFIKIPIEYTVILTVSILVLVVIAYAIGVERGKRIAGRESGESVYTPAVEDVYYEEEPREDTGSKEGVYPEEVAEMLPENNEVGSQAVEGEELAEKEEKGPHGSEDAVTTSPEREYTVQLASFKGKEAARIEVKKLEDKGINAGFSEKGDWFQVYSSGYFTIEEAKEAKAMLSEDYEDCFIRRIK